MEVVVRGQNLEVTDALEAYLKTKLQKLEKYPGIESAHARMAVDGEAHVVEVTVPVEGRTLRAEAESTNMYASVDQVTDRLLHQIQKARHRAASTKTRPISQRTSRPSASEAEETVMVAVGDQELPTEVVRVKRFPSKPMTVDEAVMRLEMVGHDFFAFRDAGSGEVCVIYRRRNGDFGLLTPEE